MLGHPAIHHVMLAAIGAGAALVLLNGMTVAARGFRSGRDGDGNLAPLQLRNISSIGQAGVLGHTCNGAYYKLRRIAARHRDAETGQCSAISMQYHIPGSVNQDLDRTGQSGQHY